MGCLYKDKAPVRSGAFLICWFKFSGLSETGLPLWGDIFWLIKLFVFCGLVIDRGILHRFWGLTGFLVDSATRGSFRLCIRESGDLRFSLKNEIPDFSCGLV